MLFGIGIKIQHSSRPKRTHSRRGEIEKRLLRGTKIPKFGSCSQSEENVRCCAMNSAKWLIGYGIFLFLCGVAGYLSNPAGAKTALLSGSLFGGLAVVFGVLSWSGKKWAQFMALAMALMLVVVFGWRSTMGWIATSAGEPKLFAASLISLMLLASLATVVVLWRARKS